MIETHRQSALILRRAQSARLEGWGGPMVRDASLRDAPLHEGREMTEMGNVIMETVV
jgi:hypothetical protein